MPQTTTLPIHTVTPAPTAKSDPTIPIDLLRGHPTHHLLATGLLQHATQTVLTSTLPNDSYAQIRHPLTYGPDYGNQDVRKEILAWQSEKYAPEYAADDIDKEGHEGGEWRINLTCGASYGLMNALQQFTSPGTGYTRRAFVIAPTYYLACAIFMDAGFSDLITALPYPPPSDSSDSDHPQTLPSLLLSALQLEESRSPKIPLSSALRPTLRPGTPQKRIYKYVLYCVPTYGNPTGLTWDLETRKEIVRIAREYDVLIITDDVYDFLSWERDVIPLPRLVSLDRQLVLEKGGGKVGKDPMDGREDAGNTISNCSFSKLLGPGLRCGWQETATGRLARQLAEGGANHSGGCPSHFVSAVLYELLKKSKSADARGKTENGKSEGSGRKIDETIDHIARVYGQRAKAFMEAIDTYLPPGSEVLHHPNPGGGYFLWVGIGPDTDEEDDPNRVDAREVVKLAKIGEGKEGWYRVTIASGDMSEAPGDGNRLNVGDRWIRISVSYCEVNEGVEGIRRLARAIERWRKGERPK